MRLTNNHNMPMVYASAIQRSIERYEARRPQGRLSFSVTTLASPAYKYKLQRAHEADYEIDVADQFLSFRGQMMHKVLEDTKLMNAFQEPELGVDISGVWVTGRPDIILPGTIEDFKMKTVEAFWNQRDMLTELSNQLNPYRYILWKVFRLPIEKLSGHIFLMNWVKRKAQFEKGYPSKPHFEIIVPTLSYEATRAYLEERIALFLLPFGKTEICSPAERWRQETKYAVIKKGNKKATKKLDTLEQAELFVKVLKDKGKEAVIEERCGTDARCTNFCSCNNFCPYWIEHYSDEPRD